LAGDSEARIDRLATEIAQLQKRYEEASSKMRAAFDGINQDSIGIVEAQRRAGIVDEIGKEFEPISKESEVFTSRLLTLSDAIERDTEQTYLWRRRLSDIVNVWVLVLYFLGSSLALYAVYIEQKEKKAAEAHKDGAAHDLEKLNSSMFVDGTLESPKQLIGHTFEPTSRTLTSATVFEPAGFPSYSIATTPEPTSRTLTRATAPEPAGFPSYSTATTPLRSIEATTLTHSRIDAAVIFEHAKGPRTWDVSMI
jgi:hypothetical protein